MKNNNGIEPKTWKDFSKLKKEVETMLDRKIDNNYLLNLLIAEGKLIINGKTLVHKIEKINIPLVGIKNEKDSHSNPDIQ